MASRGTLVILACGLALLLALSPADYFDFLTSSSFDSLHLGFFTDIQRYANPFTSYLFTFLPPYDTRPTPLTTLPLDYALCTGLSLSALPLLGFLDRFAGYIGNSNGNIYTSDPNNPHAECILVESGIISLVSSRGSGTLASVLVLRTHKARRRQGLLE
jgi:hypothetical protein